jgi:hypothetical protein
MKTMQYRIPRWLKWAAVLLAVAAVCLGALTLAERVLLIERYRPQLEQAVLDATGLPVSFGTLDVHWVPLSVTVDQPLLAGDGFQIGAASVRAVPRIKPLFRGMLELDIIDVDAPEIRLSDDRVQLRDAMDTFQAHREGRKQDRPAGPRRITLDRIVLRNGLLFIGDDTNPAVRLDGEVADPLGPEVRVTAEARFPQWGPGATGSVEAVVLRAPDQSPETSASAALRGLEVPSMSAHPHAPAVRLDVDIESSALRPGLVRLVFSGAISPLQDAPDAVRELAGDCSGEVVWEAGALSMTASWEAPGGEGSAILARMPDETFRLEVPHLALGRGTLVTLAPWAVSKRFTTVVREEAGLSIEELVVGILPEGGYSATSGTASLHGLDLHGEHGGPVFSDIRAEAEAVEGAFHFTQVLADGLELTGVVTPEPGGAVIELKGTGTISGSQLNALADLGPVTDTRGTVGLDRLAIHIGGEERKNRVEVDGTLSGGGLAIETTRFADTLGAIESQFTATDHEVSINATGSSDQFGPVRAEGVYTYASRRWEGDVRLDASAWKPPVGPETLPGKLATAALGQLGTSTLHLQVEGPVKDNRRVAVAWDRKESPGFTGKLLVVHDGQQWRLDMIEASATLEAAGLAGAVHEALSGSGPVAVQFGKQSGAARFSARADLTPVAFWSGDRISKTAGQAALVTLGGSAGENWKPDQLDFTILGESVSARLGAEGLVAENLDLSLAPLGTLLTGGLAPAGRVTGTLRTGPLDADLRLHDVTLEGPSGPVIENASGGLRISEGGWSLEQMAVRAPGVDGVLDLQYGEGGWEGILTGERADLLQVLELPRRLRGESATTSTPGDTPRAARKLPDGTLAVEMKELVFRNTPLSDASANVRLASGAVVVENVNARPVTGTMTGTVRVEPQSEGGLPWVDLDLAFEQAGMEALDALLFETPRGFKGVFDGAVELHFPVGTGQPALNRASGAMVFKARDGNLGRFGFATQLLAVLRTTELLTLRLPSGNDGGLAFNTSDVVLRMDEGVITLRTFSVENPTLKMHAEGTVDLPADQTNVRIQASVLGAVSGAAGALGLETVSRGIERYSSLELLATGPPAKPTITPNAAAPAHMLKDSIVGSESIPSMVLQTPRDLLRGILGRARGEGRDKDQDEERVESQDEER